MAFFLLKLVVTPLLIGAASRAARRWGPTAGGWIVSLPLTSGPVALFLAVEHGTTFAAAAAHASLAGCLAIDAYCLVYARGAARGWPVALAFAALGWLAGALLAEATSSWLAPVTLAMVVAATAGALALLPAPVTGQPTERSGRGDLLVRMAVGALIVVAVTELAEAVGPTISGLLAMLPIIGTVLAVFAQRSGGPAAGIGVQRGILSGLFGTAVFLAAVSVTIEQWSIAASFIAALAAIAVVQVLAFRFIPGARGPVGRTPDPASQPG